MREIQLRSLFEIVGNAVHKAQDVIFSVQK